ncbi:hypothetical protein ACEWY4_008206 [Coilia grayii]|uniref:Cation efflux protein cytoplasmic domain-containing protein n=1 Tax=Coilia grayii TaxID=363190 RepID=A0ABD1KA94_9TELE
MDGHVRLRSNHIGQRCVLGLTLLLLLFEVIVSRLCNCLINMVDSFHTLYILFHLALRHLWAGQRPVGPSPSSPIPPATSSQPPSSPHISLSSTHSGLHPDLTETAQEPASIPTTPTPTPTPTQDSPLSEPRVVARIQPFGALVSALLVASLCVSVTLEILHHALQPHPIQRPILATVASALSLLFNTAVLGLTWTRPLGASAGFPSTTESPQSGLASVTEDELTRGGLGDGSLLFCNPAASSVLDGKPVAPVAPDSLGCDRHEVLPSAEPKASKDPPNDSPQHKSRRLELEDCPSRLPTHTGHTGLTAALNPPPLSEPNGAPSTAQRSSCLRVKTAILRDLLCPCLALANALTALLGSPDCHHPEEACSDLVYLDPAVSTVAVLVLLAFTLPQVHRLGLLLLQSCPPGLSVPELRNRLVAVRGVEGVHELHVWQLTESCLVASVHVHVNAQHWWEGPNKVVAGVTETLHHAGVSLCTVQPEVLNEDISGEIVLPAVPSAVGDWPCTLPCGKECLKKLCCSPLTHEDKRDHAPPGGDEDREAQQAVVIENTFL